MWAAMSGSCTSGFILPTVGWSLLGTSYRTLSAKVDLSWSENYAIMKSLLIAAVLDEGFHLFECFLKYKITNPTMTIITAKISTTTMTMPAVAPAVTWGGKCDLESEKRDHL